MSHPIEQNLRSGHINLGKHHENNLEEDLVHHHSDDDSRLDQHHIKEGVYPTIQE